MDCDELRKQIAKVLIHVPERGDWPWEEHCDGIAGSLIDGPLRQVIGAAQATWDISIEMNVRCGFYERLLTDVLNEVEPTQHVELCERIARALGVTDHVTPRGMVHIPEDEIEAW